MDRKELNERLPQVVDSIVKSVLEHPNLVPVYEVEVHDPQDELPRLRERYPDHESALVNVHVHYTAGVDSLKPAIASISREIRSTSIIYVARATSP